MSGAPALALPGSVLAETIEAPSNIYTLLGLIVTGLLAPGGIRLYRRRRRAGPPPTPATDREPIETVETYLKRRIAELETEAKALRERDELLLRENARLTAENEQWENRARAERPDRRSRRRPQQTDAGPR